MARYKKGESGNLQGRGKNVPNKLRKELRDTINQIISAEAENIPHLLENLEPERRVKIFIELLQFVLSKPRPDEAEPLQPADHREGFVELVMKQYNSLKQSGSSIKPVKVETVNFFNEEKFPRH